MHVRIRAHPGRWLVALCVILLCDTLYFSALGSVVYPLDTLEVSWRHAALAYLVISLGLSSIEVQKPGSAALCGLLVGAFVYGVFNGIDGHPARLAPECSDATGRHLYGSLPCSAVLTVTSRLGPRPTCLVLHGRHK